ncbi:PH domain-containing protein [Natronosalvus caseinilyticus]|uniref:PH domain-containing protein n=1 Tax=Natronosalvus caseinilyticus TaxID=2953747 RepID=UPI0028AA8840|nr:PH domain-containing protein [Natronosalvus caseinilyticus]
MTRGRPAVWSTILGLPFVLIGVYLFIIAADATSELGLPPLFFGLFIVFVGLYVHYIATPSSPRLRDDEEIIEIRHPTQRVAAAKLGIGIPVLLVTAYLLFFTMVPYVYPTAMLLIGLYFFSTGLYVYWTNTLTTYYVTSNRVIKEFRFLSLIRQEVPLNKVRGVQERKSLTESLVGLGNVRVASGGGRSLEVNMRNMTQSAEFAESIRELM